MNTVSGIGPVKEKWVCVERKQNSWFEPLNISFYVSLSTNRMKNSIVMFVTCARQNHT